VLLRADRRAVRHGDFTSRADLIDKIETYVIEKNTTATPIPMGLRRHRAQDRMTPDELTRRCTGMRLRSV
jgi:hypothetical protein